MTPKEAQKQITAREYLILDFEDKICRIQDLIDTLQEEIRELEKEEEKKNV